MERILIVNADDCNLTRGVTRAILDCHDRGIVTSTTFLINLPIEQTNINQLKKRKRLGIGLHLNLTLGKPVSEPHEVSSLVGVNGIFKRQQVRGRRTSELHSRHVLDEYECQIKKFRRVFGRKPTHLDTHHQLHDHAFHYEILTRIAKRHRLPVRRCKRTPTEKKQRATSVRTTDHLFGDLDVRHHWNRTKLERTLEGLPIGVSELMCHPGRNDRDLKKISSFQRGRTTEWRIFRCGGLRKRVRALNIKLCHYGML